MGRLIFNGVPLAHRKTGYPREEKGIVENVGVWISNGEREEVEMCSNEVKKEEKIIVNTTAAFILFSNDTHV